jgi:biotin carboxylase
MAARVLLLLPTTSYRSQDFIAAAERLEIEIVVGTDRRQALQDAAPGNTLTVDSARREQAVRRIVEAHSRTPFRAVLGVDDETTALAAAAAAALGLPHNSEAAVRAARDKYETRRLMRAAGMGTPGFRRCRLDDSPDEAARRVAYPCVLKPLRLSGSRGVMRADDPAEFVAAFRRIAAILRDPDVERKAGPASHLLVEDYLPGDEVALEGLLRCGKLRSLALFDKPDPLEGPTFAETIYVTPSRLPEPLRTAIAREAAAGCRALGLRDGPVHAELRLRDGQPWLLEIAPRTIGGLCSRALRFDGGVTLEELILLHAVGPEAAIRERERRAAGVMMMPVPRAGKLRAIRGLARARSVPLVEELTLTVHRGAELLPLPEGDRYVGFIFARGDTPASVEQALRTAYARIHLEIDEPPE